MSHGAVAKWQTRRSAKPLIEGSNPSRTFPFRSRRGAIGAGTAHAEDLMFRRAQFLLPFLLLVLALASAPSGLGAAPDLPTPEQFAGHRIGADDKLVRWDRIVEYMTLVSQSSDRVRLRELGKSTNGAPSDSERWRVRSPDVLDFARQPSLHGDSAVEGFACPNDRSVTPCGDSPALASILVASASFLAQERRDQSTFQTGVELVQLDVSVLDEKRQPVRGLGVADFTVLENGVPRPIRAFTPSISRHPPAAKRRCGQIPSCRTSRQIKSPRKRGGWSSS